jgi:divinyl protochlorophyllide a 8-vinyl-reductase
VAGATSKWRTPEDDPRGALIGPNAILQLIPVLDQAGGLELRQEVMARAGVFELPDGSEMIPEGPAARLHQALRAAMPDLAPVMAAEAGRRTADYILAHRIPLAAQRALKLLPAPVAAFALSKAIDKHAWTFVGSGQFTVLSSTRFEIGHNPVVQGEVADHPLCDWHAAVFARLYQELVHPDFFCVETACSAQNGSACIFELIRHPR